MQDLDHGAGVVRAAPDVEDLSGRAADSLEGVRVEAVQVADVEQVAHLEAVAVDRQRSTPDHGVEEVGDPPLVLVPVLVRAVDA